MAQETGYNMLTREEFDIQMGDLAINAILAHTLADGVAIDDIAIRMESLVTENPGHFARLQEYSGSLSGYLAS